MRSTECREDRHCDGDTYDAADDCRHETDLENRLLGVAASLHRHGHDRVRHRCDQRRHGCEGTQDDRASRVASKRAACDDQNRNEDRGRGLVVEERGHQEGDDVEHGSDDVSVVDMGQDGCGSVSEDVGRTCVSKGATHDGDTCIQEDHAHVHLDQSLLLLEDSGHDEHCGACHGDSP